MGSYRAAITGVGGYAPEYVLDNKELESIVDTNDEWIVTRTGIKERRILKGEGLGTSFMGEKAVKELLDKTNTEPSSVDLVICATVTPDFVFPATANLLCDYCGLDRAASFDLGAACSGFLYALTTGTQYIESGMYQKVIVVGSDKMSSIVDYNDRSTCILFGDGAGAVMLERSEDESGVLDSIMRTDGSGMKYLHQKAGGSRRPASYETIAKREHYLYQEGSSVFKFAVNKMADVSVEIMERNKLSSDDVAYLVPHQANKRIIDATAKKMRLPEERIMLNIHKYGNTTAATIPLCMWDYENKLKKGDNLILAAFGGGFTWGSTYVKWAYDPQN